MPESPRHRVACGNPEVAINELVANFRENSLVRIKSTRSQITKIRFYVASLAQGFSAL